MIQYYLFDEDKLRKETPLDSHAYTLRIIMKHVEQFHGEMIKDSF